MRTISAVPSALERLASGFGSLALGVSCGDAIAGSRVAAHLGPDAASGFVIRSSASGTPDRSCGSERSVWLAGR
jgi:hypothetical protein